MFIILIRVIFHPHFSHIKIDAVALHTAVSSLTQGKIGILNKEFLPETRKDDAVEPESLVSVPIIPGLNPSAVHMM